MTLLLFSMLGILLAFGWEYVCTHIIKKTSFILFGWRLHHSLFGLMFIFLGFLTQNIILIGVGVGILIQHIATDGFRFMSK